MESRISKLEALIPTLATKADIGEVRADLHKMDASIVRWMIATVIGLFLGFAGLFFTVSSAFKGSSMQPVAAQPQPIIIQIPSPTGQDSQYQPARGETDRRPQLQRPTGDKDPPK